MGENIKRQAATDGMHIILKFPCESPTAHHGLFFPFYHAENPRLAGNAVANRVTENPDYNVLVLEAGGTSVEFHTVLTHFLVHSIIHCSEMRMFYPPRLQDIPATPYGARSIGITVPKLGLR